MTDKVCVRRCVFVKMICDYCQGEDDIIVYGIPHHNNHGVVACLKCEDNAMQTLYNYCLAHYHYPTSFTIFRKLFKKNKFYITTPNGDKEQWKISTSCSTQLLDKIQINLTNGINHTNISLDEFCSDNNLDQNTVLDLLKQKLAVYYNQPIIKN